MRFISTEPNSVSQQSGKKPIRRDTLRIPFSVFFFPDQQRDSLRFTVNKQQNVAPGLFACKIFSNCAAFGIGLCTQGRSCGDLCRGKQEMLLYVCFQSIQETVGGCCRVLCATLVYPTLSPDRMAFNGRWKKHNSAS